MTHRTLISNFGPRRFALIACLLILGPVLMLAGCAKDTVMVAAPNLYADASAQPYADVPEALRTTDVQVLYATDRQFETIEDVYGYNSKRSRSTGFGLCTVEMGKPDSTWDELVVASTTHERKLDWPLTLTGIDERGRYPALGPAVQIDGKWMDDPAYTAECEKLTKQVHQLLAEQLARTPHKEVFIFVHGYNNSFATGAFRSAQIWHFLGRGGVPVLYSWPAGSTGLLQGYTRDRESSEFTIPHFKIFLRAIASCPEVEKIHIIGHSRGTDVVANALRELHLECRGGDRDTRKELKIGQIVLAAPDIDLDVFMEKFSADRVGHVAERLTIYVSGNDKVIGLSTWLFGSLGRVGRLSFGDLPPEVQGAVKTHPVMCVVDVRAKTDRTGHGYFLSSPAVLSDLILILRDKYKPGEENGRPLKDVPMGFWELDDGYPFINSASAGPK